MKTDHATGPHRFAMEGWIACAPFERLLHMEIVAAADGQAVLTMPFLIDFAQGAGLMHGGALISLADTAVVMAIKSIVPPGTHFVTTHCETRFLAPVKQGVVAARAWLQKQEGRVLQGQATVYDADSRAVLEFVSTFKIARDASIRAVTFSAPGPQGRE